MVTLPFIPLYIQRQLWAKPKWRVSLKPPEKTNSPVNTYGPEHTTKIEHTTGPEYTIGIGIQKNGDPVLCTFIYSASIKWHVSLKLPY